MSAIERLEKWKAGHKNRSVEIGSDDGYGANCWTVDLKAGKEEVSAIEVCFWKPPKGGWPENVVFVGEKDGEDDWPGLEKTILAAVDLAERLGI